MADSYGKKHEVRKPQMKPDDRREKTREERQPKKSPTPPIATGATLVATTTSSSCAICQREHSAWQCPTLQEATIFVRRAMIQSSGVCYRCLDRGHSWVNCEKSCTKCGGPHHQLSCFDKKKKKDGRAGWNSGPKKFKKKQRPEQRDSNREKTEVKPNLTALSTGIETSTVVMQTLQIEVQGKAGKTKANVLFDTGSDRSYISTKLRSQIKPDYVKSEFVSYSSFGGNEPNSTE